METKTKSKFEKINLVRKKYLEAEKETVASKSEQIKLAKKKLLDLDDELVVLENDIVKCEKHHPCPTVLHTFINIHYDLNEVDPNWGPKTKEWFDLILQHNVLEKAVRIAKYEYDLARSETATTFEVALKY